MVCQLCTDIILLVSSVNQGPGPGQGQGQVDQQWNGEGVEWTSGHFECELDGL